MRGAPAHISFNNGLEFIAEAGTKPSAWRPLIILILARRTPKDNGYCESFNIRFWDELLIGELLYILRKAQIVIEKWQRHYNTKCPHSALGYSAPEPKTIAPIEKKVDDALPFQSE